MLKNVLAAALTRAGLYGRRIRGELSASPARRARLNGRRLPPEEALIERPDQLADADSSLRRRWWIARFSDELDD